MAILLNEIKDNKGARSPRKRLGRGIGSGLGKTSGRGGKGQTARTGVAINGFEGGQTPIYRRLPKRGFTNIHAHKLYELTFKTISVLDKKGLLTKDTVINLDYLVKNGVAKQWYDGVSLINTGELTSKVNLEVTRATKSAQAVVEKLGGKISIA